MQLKSATSRARKTLVIVLIINHIFLLWGCTTTRRAVIGAEELDPNPTSRITELVLNTGEVIRFGQAGGRYLENIADGKLQRIIVGTTVQGKIVEIDPQSVVEVHIERKETDTTGTTLLVLAVGALVGAVAFVFFLAIAFGGH